MIQKLIRFEHPIDGLGIFCGRIKDNYYWNGFAKRSYSSRTSILSSVNKAIRFFNNPSNVFVNFNNRLHFFAFLSLVDLHNIITTEDLNTLMGLGFKAYKIEVSDYQISEKEAIFTKESIVSKLDITDSLCF